MNSSCYVVLGDHVTNPGGYGIWGFEVLSEKIDFFFFFLFFFKVTGPQGNRVHESTTKDSEKFEFRAYRRGLYTFCFHGPSLTPEQLTFYIHVGHIPGIQDLAQDGRPLSL